MALFAPHLHRTPIGNGQIIPTGPVTVDRSNPLTDGLVAAFLPGLTGSYDYTQNFSSVPVLGAPALSDVGPYQFDYLVDNAPVPLTQRTLAIGQGYTFMIVSRNFASQPGGIVALGEPTSSSLVFYVNAGQVVWAVNNNGTGQPFTNSVAQSSVQRSLAYAGTNGDPAIPYSGTGTIYADGIPVTASGSMGNIYFPSTNFWVPGGLLTAMWFRQLSDAEIAAVDLAPFRLFRPAVARTRSVAVAVSPFVRSQLVWMD